MGVIANKDTMRRSVRDEHKLLVLWVGHQVLSRLADEPW
jgi:hypothetical protein